MLMDLKKKKKRWLFRSSFRVQECEVNVCFGSQRRSSADVHQRPRFSPHAALHHHLQVCTGETHTFPHTPVHTFSLVQKLQGSVTQWKRIWPEVRRSETHTLWWWCGFSSFSCGLALQLVFRTGLFFVFCGDCKRSHFSFYFLSLFLADSVKVEQSLGRGDMNILMCSELLKNQS